MMTTFKCDNPFVEEKLLKLQELIILHGGSISEAISILEEDGEFSIIPYLSEEAGKEIISIPDACLPRLEDFSITVQGDQFMVEPKSDLVGESHYLTIQLMIDIYNLTGKLYKHKKYNPWVALQSFPRIMGKLHEARAGAPRIKQFYEKYLNGEFSDLLAESFFVDRAIGIFSDNQYEPLLCLMPFIEYTNHYIDSPSYTFSEDEERVVSLLHSIRKNKKTECCVRYGLLDALDAFLIHGFIDADAPFVRSVPLQFDLHELSSVRIQSYITQVYNRSLPVDVEDLRFYFPNFLGGNDSLIELSHLFIPGKSAPLALRRLLTFYIHGWKPALSTNMVHKIVENAEDEIINKNIEYYSQLKLIVNEIPAEEYTEVIRSVAMLVDVQLNKIYEYQDRINNISI